MGEIKLGKSMLKNTAGQTRGILKKQYPKESEAAIDAAIKKYYSKDEGAEKLNAEKDKTDGNTGPGSAKSKSPTK